MLLFLLVTLKIVETLAAYVAFVWPFLRKLLHLFLQVVSWGGALVTFIALEWLLSCVGPLMCIQIT